MYIFFKVLPFKYKPLTNNQCQAALCGFFQEFAHVNSWESKLKNVIANAYSINSTIPNQSAGSLLYFGSQFNTLIFGTFYPIEQQREKPVLRPSWDDLIDATLLESNPYLLDRINLLPMSRSKEEIQKPSLFLISIFSQKPLKKWYMHWYILLEFSFSNSSLKEYDELESRRFEGLLEVFHLLYIRNFQTNPQNHENNQN